jgi:uncharacterized protein (UPF0335 family)
MGRPLGSKNKPKEAEAEIGHNSHVTQFDQKTLESLVSRIEDVENEKQAAADDIKEIYAEAKTKGFDVGALKAVVKIRKQGTKLVNEARQNAIDAYLHALGALAGTPLGQAAVNREFGEAANPV